MLAGAKKCQKFRISFSGWRWSPSPQPTGVHWYGPGPTGDERRPPGSSESVGGGGCVDVRPGKGWGRPGNRGNEPPPSPSPHLSTPTPILMGVVINLMLYLMPIVILIPNPDLQVYSFLYHLIHYVSRAIPWERTSNNVQACRSHISTHSSLLI